MNSRERVIHAINHEHVDRIPIYWGGTSSWMTDRAYMNLVDHLGLDGYGRPYRTGHTGNYIDNRILELFNVDVRMLQMQISIDEKRIDNNTIVSDWGILLRTVDGYGIRIDPPFASLDIERALLNGSLSELIDAHSWPDPFDARRTLGLEEDLIYHQERSDAALVARSPQSASFIEYGCWLRGDAQFYMDLYLYPEFINMLLDKILEIQKGFYTSFLQVVGGSVDIVETSEDYGTQDGLLISPEQLREYIFPRRKELNRHIRDLAPDIKIMHHSCGAVTPIIGDLYQTGVDILNPIQPIADLMDHSMLKESYGDKMVFCGGLDMIGAMTRSEESIEQEIRKRVDIFGHDGGYLISTSNHLQRDTSPEQIVYVFERLKELV